MEINLKTTVTLAALLLTGLSAGLFVAWTISVIPGTKRLSDFSYLETMQEINRAILNPYFFVVFIGPIFFLLLQSYMEFKSGVDTAFWLSAMAALCYIGGTFLVTGMGNVPLNNGLDMVTIESVDLSELKKIRISYETQWNRFHMIRTAFSLISFLLALIAQYAASKP